MAIVMRNARQYAREAVLADIGRARDLQAIELPPVSFDAQKDQGWVVGPQVFGFLKGVTVERREMITDSALFASLVADAATSRSDAQSWYEAYTGALTNLGWVLQEGAKRSFEQRSTGSQVHEAVLEFIAAAGVGGGALALITAALKSLHKVDGEDQPWITLFDYQTRQQDISGFQVGLVENTEEGMFQVKLMTFSLELKQTRAQVLFIKFGDIAIRMDSVANTVTVSEAVLRDAMPVLRGRLQQYVKRFVAEVPLPALP